jgi:hypothetical protein
MRRTFAVAAAAAASLLAMSGTAQAAETYVPAADLGAGNHGEDSSICRTTTTSGWCTYTQGDGTVRLVEAAPGTPSGQHLELSTPPVTTGSSSKAFAFEYDNRGPLGSITTLSYAFLVQHEGTIAEQAPALNVEITTVNGVDATLVYEPLYAGYQPSTTWTPQAPTSADGGWWVSQPGGVTTLQTALQKSQAANSGVYGGATWEEVQTFFTGATVHGIGVNQGGGNAGLVSQVDLLTVNGTTYDFGAAPVVAPEPPAKPQTADDCKNGGWRNYTAPAFPNQGQCIQFVNTGKVGQGATPAPTSATPSTATIGKVRAA